MSHDPVFHADDRLAAALDPDAADRLRSMVAEVLADATRIRVHLPAAARIVGRGPLEPGDAQGLLGPTLDDVVRGELLVALRRATEADPDRRAREVADLYRFGDADEKRAVLRFLHRLDLGDAAAGIVREALRTNDLRLVAAALGPYAAEHLDPDAWRHGVLKCLFVGVPVAVVAGLDARADHELARMVTSYVDERRAAGRDVPADADLVLAASSTVSEES